MVLLRGFLRAEYDHGRVTGNSDECGAGWTGAKCPSGRLLGNYPRCWAAQATGYGVKVTALLQEIWSRGIASGLGEMGSLALGKNPNRKVTDFWLRG